MSVITVALLATFIWGNFLSNLQSFDLQIGGLNASELADLRSLAAPVESSVREEFGAWSGTWVVELPQFGGTERMRLLSTPPIKHAAPFLAKIKTWGYQITFYQSYQEKQEIFRQSCVSVESTPSLVHSWILEKDADLVILPPPPSPTTTLFPPSTSTPSTTTTIISTSSTIINTTTTLFPDSTNGSTSATTPQDVSDSTVGTSTTEIISTTPKAAASRMSGTFVVIFAIFVTILIL
ncbi:putative uncharacterized protein F40H6.5 [Folsomia candida]|uniref:putative uncharacterized protein F40H6.5 n=1 Tax=Folsomia candida TaxID=158441 RepID=UPI001604ECBB|nr:putative uncharacterized protein F40H6.5 [Folsomia candida]